MYSNTDNIQANLCYLDYTRLKKQEEAKRKAHLPVVPEDFKDLSGFVGKLIAHADPISQHLWSQCSPATQETLTDVNTTAEQKGIAVSEGISKVLQTDPLYELSRFAGVNLSPRTTELLSQRPEGVGLIRLNRMLLEDAFPDQIMKHSDTSAKGDSSKQDSGQADIATAQADGGSSVVPTPGPNGANSPQPVSHQRKPSKMWREILSDLPFGISDTTNWSDQEIRSALDRTRAELDWANTTGSARKWWEAFETENQHRLNLVLRLCEELANRKATITEFFLAYVYSNTDNIQANLCYLDYTRLKKEEERKRREAAEAASRPPNPDTAKQSVIVGPPDNSKAARRDQNRDNPRRKPARIK
ncbi:MAG: hypothetical protein L0387_20925 [Acidobacteria bacterium]|nr:hypothetical protein [Acidobacteriota bacterium]